MLAIEFRRMAKDLALLGLIFGALCAGCAWTQESAVLAPALELVLLLFAVYAGWSLMERERQDGATEYLLSLPFSRLGLLLRKLLPRLVAAAVPLGAYMLVHPALDLPSLLLPRDLAMTYGGFFLIGLSLSLSLRTFISALFFTLLIHPGQILLMKPIDPLLPLSDTIAYAGASGIILAVLFVFAFRTWDIRSISALHRRFLIPALLAVLVVPALVFFTYGKSWGLYHLSDEGTLIRSACNRSEAVGSGGGWRFATCMTALRQMDDGTLYLAKRKLDKNGPCRITGMVRYRPSAGTWENLPPLPEGWRLLTGVAGETGARRGESLFLSLMHRDGPGTFAILEVRGLQTRLLPVLHQFDSARVYVLAAAPGADRFLLHDGRRLWDWAPGESPRELLAADTAAAWRDHVLVMDSAGVRRFRWSRRGLEETAGISGPLTWVRRWGGGLRSRHMLFRRGADMLHLDMETPGTRLIHLDSPPVNYVDGPRGLTVVSREDGRLRVDTWEKGSRLTRYWQPGIDFQVVSVFHRGIVVFNARHFEVYRFGLN